VHEATVDAAIARDRDLDLSAWVVAPANLTVEPWWRGSVHLCVMTPRERGVDRALSTLYPPDGGLS
jgi:hypothetical protein